MSKTTQLPVPPTPAIADGVTHPAHMATPRLTTALAIRPSGATIALSAR